MRIELPIREMSEPKPLSEEQRAKLLISQAARIMGVPSEALLSAADQVRSSQQTGLTGRKEADTGYSLIASGNQSNSNGITSAHILQQEQNTTGLPGVSIRHVGPEGSPTALAAFNLQRENNHSPVSLTAASSGNDSLSCDEDCSGMSMGAFTPPEPILGHHSSPLFTVNGHADLQLDSGSQPFCTQFSPQTQLVPGSTPGQEFFISPNPMDWAPFSITRHTMTEPSTDSGVFAEMPKVGVDQMTNWPELGNGILRYHIHQPLPLSVSQEFLGNDSDWLNRRGREPAPPRCGTRDSTVTAEHQTIGLPNGKLTPLRAKQATPRRGVSRLSVKGEAKRRVSRRAPYQDKDREETSITRKMRCCVRCRMNRERVRA
jgi:hypothetical protein